MRGAAQAADLPRLREREREAGHYGVSNSPLLCVVRSLSLSDHHHQQKHLCPSCSTSYVLRYRHSSSSAPAAAEHYRHACRWVWQCKIHTDTHRTPTISRNMQQHLYIRCKHSSTTLSLGSCGYFPADLQTALALVTHATGWCCKPCCCMCTDPSPCT